MGLITNKVGAQLEEKMSGTLDTWSTNHNFTLLLM